MLSCDYLAKSGLANQYQLDFDDGKQETRLHFEDNVIFTKFERSV